MMHARRLLAWMVTRVVPGSTVTLLLVMLAYLLGHAATGADQPVSVQVTWPVAPPPRPTTDLYGDPLPAGAIVRLGSVRLRHLGLIDSFILPDGKTARTIGRDGFIRSWNLTTGR